MDSPKKYVFIWTLYYLFNRLCFGFLAVKAQEERLKQLERWKERKALEREKEKREKQQKGVFKTGLYHPKDVFTGAAAPPASAKLKEVRKEF